MTDSIWNAHEHGARIPNTRSIVARLAFCTSKTIRVLTVWRERARQRRALIGLDDRMLRDIGVTRVDAQQEYEKPFWR
jgi:uncharacterized protein YjiS (DUF1127 family)